MSEELFESLIELHTPVCASVADAERELRRLRAHAVCGRRRQRPAARLGRHASVQPVRAPARDRPRALSGARRRAAVRRAPRADLRPARPRRRRRSRPRGARRRRAAGAPVRAGRAVGQLAILARRAHRARLLPAPDLLGVPALRAAAAASATTRSSPRSSQSSSRPAASRTTRGSGGTCGRIPASARSRCA